MSDNPLKQTPADPFAEGAEAARALTDAENELRAAQADAVAGGDDDEAATARLSAGGKGWLKRPPPVALLRRARFVSGQLQ